MNIAMMVRGYIPAPRPADMIYAPIDLAAAIGEGLAKRGHKIDFYGPLGTTVEDTQVRTCNLRPLVNKQEDFKDILGDSAKMSHYVPALWDQYMVSDMFARAEKGKYDLLHFHHPEAAMPAAMAHGDIPVVYTVHDPIYDWYRELFELYYSPNQHFISISKNQRRDAPDLPYLATVYNGISAEQYPFNSEPEDYLLYAGRIVPEKGVKEAIQVAKQTKKRLLIIGPVYADQQGYFDQYIKPHLDDKILYLGYVEHGQMWRYYQKAHALLTPVQWEEPFGLTTIEAMATGTPVISLRRGACQEIIKEGKNGFIVDSITEMIKAVERLDTIKREDCRESVKLNFSVERMLDGYETAFENVLRQRKKISSHYVMTQLYKAPIKLKSKIEKARTR